MPETRELLPEVEREAHPIPPRPAEPHEPHGPHGPGPHGPGCPHGPGGPHGPGPHRPHIDRESYEKLDTDGKLFALIQALGHAGRFRFDERGGQSRALRLLPEQGSMTQRELTERLGIQPGSASELVGKLERAGLVARTPSQTDRRTADVALTEAGRARREQRAAMEERQRSGLFAVCQDREVNVRLGKIKRANSNPSMATATRYVSKEQPSIADDPNLINAFYDAPTVITFFAPKNFLFAAEDCACAAENMMLMADSLGVGSCYISQGWTAFADPYGQEVLKKWAIRPDYYALMQLLLGYPKAGDAHPAPKPRKDGRVLRF